MYESISHEPQKSFRMRDLKLSFDFRYKNIIPHLVTNNDSRRVAQIINVNITQFQFPDFLNKCLHSSHNRDENIGTTTRRIPFCHSEVGQLSPLPFHTLLNRFPPIR